jgi:hypothetical protein
MPMNTESEFAMGDSTKDYCVHCMRPDGSMQSYQEKLDSMSNFIIKTQGLDKTVAVCAAKNMMAKLPAWKDICTN